MAHISNDQPANEPNNPNNGTPPDDVEQVAEQEIEHAPEQTSEQSPKQSGTKASRNTTAESLGVLLFLLIVVLILVGLWFVWFRGLGVLAVAETALRAKGYLLLSTGAPLLASYLLWSRGQSVKEKVKPSERKNLPEAKRWGRLAGAGLLVAVLGGGYSFAVHPYLVAKTYTADTHTTEETLSFADRAPWVVANNYAQRDQGDIIGDRESVHYVPTRQDAAAKAGDGAGEGTSRYTVLVKERGVLGTGGYEAVQTLTMPTTGAIPSGASDFCKIPDSMTRRLDTVWPWHALSWSIHAKAPFAHWDNDDAFGYCANGQPMVVVPLYKYSGWWAVTKEPNGAAVYSEDGVEILSAQELTDRTIEGPTYPRTVASEQRTSINAGGTLMQWLGSKYGYDLTDQDEEDSNTDNPSEFTLVPFGTQDLQYVTPLTPRGSSQSMTAVSVVPASQQGEGRLPLTLNTSADLPATSTLETAIKESSVHGDNAWTTRWSAGMGVYEILPAQNGHWAASIGQGQAVSYRADIAPDGKVTVVNADTGASSDGAASSSKKKDAVTVDGGKPLDQMSEGELLKLIQDAATELEKRQGKSE